MMSTNRYLAFVLGVAFVIVLVVASVVYPNPILPRFKPQEGTPQALSPSPSFAPVEQGPSTSLMRTNTTPLSSKPVPTATPTSLTASSIEPPAGWKTYRDEEYKFRVQSPQTFYEGPVADSALSYEPLRKLHFVSVRMNGEQETIIFTVAVHNKPSSLSLLQWLSDGYKVDLIKTEEGKINIALEKAYTGKKGVVSFHESQEGNITRPEVGEAWGGNLEYATYIARNDWPYIYEVSILLPFLESKGINKPNSAYVELYNQIVSTFQFID